MGVTGGVLSVALAAVMWQGQHGGFSLPYHLPCSALCAWEGQGAHVNCLFYCRCLTCLRSVPGCLPALGTCAGLVTSLHTCGGAVQGHKAWYYADNSFSCLCSVCRSTSTYLPQQMLILENLEEMTGIEGNPL